MNELRKKLTSNEIEVMIETINDNDASQYLKNSYKKILDKFGIDYINNKLNFGKLPKKAINTYDFQGYDYMKSKNEEAGVSFLLTGEYPDVSKSIFEKDYGMWMYYNYLGRLNISFEDCQKWIKQAQNHFKYTMPIDINLVHTPNAKDGRSFALWYATKSKSKIESKMGYEKSINFSFNGTYYYQEIGMVANGDGDNGGWGDYFKERKTNLLIPQFQGTSFHFNTLIHEFAHCLDFQKQLMKKIKDYEENKSNRKKIKEETELSKEYADLEKSLYGVDIESDAVGLPITNHFDLFSDSLVEILKACANGEIPLTQKLEKDAINIQTTFSGVYGDLLLQQRERKRIQAKKTKKLMESEKGKRFTYNVNIPNLLKTYIEENQLNSQTTKISKKEDFGLAESLELNNLILAYIENDFKAIMIGSPNEAKSLIEPIKKTLAESNRLINNHYDNIINNYEYGFKPKTNLEIYLNNNCSKKDFKTYKSWKDCNLESLKKYES